MQSTHVPMVYDELLDYLMQKTPPEEILAFHASEKAQARAEELLDRNNAGTLTPEEALELQQLLDFDSRISVLKSQAALVLKTKPLLL